MRLINRSPQAEFARVIAVETDEARAGSAGVRLPSPRKELTKRNSLYITQLFYNR